MSNSEKCCKIYYIIFAQKYLCNTVHWSVQIAMIKTFCYTSISNFKIVPKNAWTKIWQFFVFCYSHIESRSSGRGRGRGGSGQGQGKMCYKGWFTYFIMAFEEGGVVKTWHIIIGRGGITLHFGVSFMQKFFSFEMTLQNMWMPLKCKGYGHIAGNCPTRKWIFIKKNIFFSKKWNKANQLRVICIFFL